MTTTTGDLLPETAVPRPMSTAKAWRKALRPKQWSKNVLVFAAPGAAGVLFTGSALVDTIIALVAFCLAASGTYLLNDAGDVEADRQHPVKRNRPIAAGYITVRTARIVGVTLLAAGIAIGFATGRWELPAVVASYVLLTTTYTIWLKHIAVIDLVSVAAGFVLRAIGGAAATGVPISNWFFIVTSFAALFMVAGKRHAEHNETDGGAGFRATLEDYSIAYLGYVRAVATGVTLVAYCLWAFERSEGSNSTILFELSIVPFLIALLRYALVVESGGGGAPEEVIIGDRPLQIAGIAWAIVMGLAIYLR